jgi:hypothetical protein
LTKSASLPQNFEIPSQLLQIVSPHDGLLEHACRVGESSESADEGVDQGPEGLRRGFAQPGFVLGEPPWSIELRSGGLQEGR